MQERRRLSSLFFQRLTVAGLIILQTVLIIYTVVSRSRSSQLFGILMTVISFFVALHIASQPRKTTYKVTWIFLILTFPLFGGLMYLLLYLQTSKKRLRSAFLSKETLYRLRCCPGDAMNQLCEQAPEHLQLVRYLQDHAGYPVYSGTQTRHLSPGEAAFPIILEELEKAENYIFLEFFIVQEGVMWNSILTILKRKAAQGVKVRLLYDDIGCFLLLPREYPQALRKYGIECITFNPFRPLLTATQNNRDHRKVLIIDGKTAFTGGINLSDEYINVYEKHGYWKDSCLLLHGKAAWSLTMTFLEMWQICSGQKESPKVFFPPELNSADCSDGFVQPFADSPIDEEYVSEYVFLQMIHNAKDYLYINTPYLAINETMMTALSLASKSGVDVRIVTPHIWDKKIVHMTTRSYYKELLNAGVRVYEYTPGFMHSKLMVSDDSSAVIGTINLDFRSLYLHFECGVLLRNSAAVMEAKEDFLRTLNDCHRITPADCKGSVLTSLKTAALRLLAPLM
ncbi:MAG: cardiolipin synthase [Eubacteriales bacterium]|nr:cardiolipin synthase [Eubacteriales bacterium]